MTPSEIDILVTMIGAFCIGAGFVGALATLIRREVFVTDNPRLAAELFYDGHPVRLITHEEWVKRIEAAARKSAMDADA